MQGLQQGQMTESNILDVNNPLNYLAKLISEQQNLMKEQQLKTNELLETLNKKIENLPKSYTPQETTLHIPTTLHTELTTASIPKEEQISSKAEIQPIPIQPISIQPDSIQPTPIQPTPIQPYSIISEVPVKTSLEDSVDIDLVFTKLLDNCEEDELRRSILKVLRVIYI